MKRKKITARQLHERLEREFRGSAADSCLACRVPMPFRIEGASGERANWRVGAIDECSTLCHSILQDIAGRLAQRYDLAETGDVPH